MKKCSYCKIEKPFTKFHRNKSGKLGYSNYCIECKKLTRDKPRSNKRLTGAFDKVRRKYIVYEFYDENNQCLYIGQSLNFINRMCEHKSDSLFYVQIKTIKCNILNSLPDMVFLEAQYIIQKKPLYNKRISGAIQSDHSIEPIDVIEYYIDGSEINKI